MSLLLSILLFADVHTARTLLKDGKIPEALREMEAALRDRPNDPEVQYQAGELLRELGDSRAARLQQLAPNSPETHELLGRSLESRGKLDEALAEYRAALHGGPDGLGRHFAVGNILWKKREFEAARAELEAELRLNSNHALASLRLGETLLSLNQPAEAAQHLRKSVGAMGSSLEAHRAMGRAFRALGQHREALEQFRIVAAGQPDDASIHTQLAGEHRALGDLAQARAESELQRKLLQAKSPAAQKH